MKYRCVEESPAGLAAFSLWIHGGRWCRPPISRQGSKSGYAHALGAIAGIRAGEGAGAYVWSEADADVLGLLRAYPDAAMLRRIAEIIRGWKDEEPRALWTRLRAERKARVERGGSVGDPEVAGWVLAGGWSYKQGEIESGFVGPGQRRQDTSAAAAAACKNLAEYAQLAASNRLINVAGPDLRNTGKGGTTFGGAEFSTPPGEVAAGFEGVAGHAAGHLVEHAYQDRSGGFKASAGGGWPDRPPDIGRTADAVEGLAREVASFQIEAQWAFRRGQPESGFNGGVATGAAWNADAATTADFNDRLPSRWPPVYVSPTIIPAADLAELLGTPGDLDGVLCYSDPPYLHTTGYLTDYPRSAVVADAIDRARMGARVMVSESAPVAELVALGWHATRIDFARRGQKRTFAKNAGEWVTSSFEPVDAYRDVEQVGLFG